ncbi:DUF5133 domain-containing protein [Kitasatospora sp. NPDC089797]|uniref:DUF5133 domain-containing protein n=1 Tax=Kitasatospora sp. NPDC089797 TaxID=3155298 RepID=UPI00342D748B
MAIVDPTALARLVAEYEALTAQRSAEARQRLRDVCYTLGVYTGEKNGARAVARARALLTRARPSAAPAAGPGAAPTEGAADGTGGLLASLGELAVSDGQRHRPTATLKELVQLSRVTVPDCVGAAVSTWHDDGTVEVLAASSPQLLTLERAQGEAGSGPLPRIRRQGDGQVVVLLDTGRPGRFTDRARRCGARSVVTAHLRAHPYGCTAYSAYLRSSSDVVGAPSEGLVAFLALQASIELDRTALARSVTDLFDRSHTTGVAIGLTMERFGVTAHTALSLLTRVAQRLGTDLDTVIRRLVADARHPLREEGPDGAAGPGR